jgi:hypothetical protein
MIFLHVIGKERAGLHRRVVGDDHAQLAPTGAMVVTTPADGAPPYSLIHVERCEQAALKLRPPVSISFSMRSRAVSRP